MIEDNPFINGLRTMMPKSIPVCSCCGMTEEEGHDSECFWYEDHRCPYCNIIADDHDEEECARYSDMTDDGIKP